MDLGIIFSGEFGRRFVLNLAYPESCPHLGACGIEFCDKCKDYDFSDKIAFVRELNLSGQLYIEDPSEYLQDLQSDVIIAINIHPDVLIELPEAAEAKALIIPIEDPSWCPLGLRKQIKEICDEIGIEFTAPKPFCSIRAGGRHIKKFCDEFRIGTPDFEIKSAGNVIEDVKAFRDTCGCAYYVAKKMKGYIITDKHELWKDVHQHQCAYPCMASMERDVEIVEAIFHLAGYIMVYNFSRALGIDAEGFIPEYMRKFVIDA
ncbi:Uncharacterized protein conserved in archaea [Archaeoglobus sulfaticallidus PM70-1]|uniref:Uncharacterized protein conserved in archaea n=1 Tax=Archaeoglobus sulfaticallidus PM70-1 TaxID=387631 RepID=N0BB46_9EURY|nr:DUF166 family protein [Archaeoglobus sulfaticallidus]AGK60829.1 Uncharacterized protein conserved in archaea [Archaeoglobus sulfaticallidus PM70-1]